MILGELISRFEDESIVIDTLSSLDDSRILRAAEQAAIADGVPLGTWARGLWAALPRRPRMSNGSAC